MLVRIVVGEKQLFWFFKRWLVSVKNQMFCLYNWFFRIKYNGLQLQEVGTPITLGIGA